MATEVTRQLAITRDNIQSYNGGVDDSSVTVRPSTSASADYMLRVESSNKHYMRLNDAAKAILYPNAVAHPVGMRIQAKFRRSGLVSGTAYFYVDVDNTEFGGWTSTSSSSDVEVDEIFSSAAVVNSNQNSEIHLSGKATAYAVFIRWVTLTLYFNRYDFAALGGTGISRTTVSESVGFDGDTITFSATVEHGYVFDGWYDGGVKVSSNPIYVHDVNGADLVLTAKARPHIAVKANGSLYDITSGTLKAAGHQKNITRIMAKVNGHLK